MTVSPSCVKPCVGRDANVDNIGVASERLVRPTLPGFEPQNFGEAKAGIQRLRAFFAMLAARCS